MSKCMMITKSLELEKMMTKTTQLKKISTSVKLSNRSTGSGLSRLVIIGSASAPVQHCLKKLLTNQVLKKLRI